MSKSFSKDPLLFSHSIKGFFFCRLLRRTLHRSVPKRGVTSGLRRGRGRPEPHLGIPASREERALLKPALSLLPALARPTTDSVRSEKR